MGAPGWRFTRRGGPAPRRGGARRGLIVLRTVFIAIVLTIGWAFALQSPIYAAALYLWIAYFRPESWAWSDLFTSLNLSYIAGAYLVLRTVMSGAAFKWNARSWLLVIFLAHSLLSTALGADAAYSFGQWQDFAKTIVVSLILTSLIDSAS